MNVGSKEKAVERGFPLLKRKVPTLRKSWQAVIIFTMWVIVPVWEELAKEALDVIDRKGIVVEVSGMLQVRLYEGKRGKSDCGCWEIEIEGSYW